MRPDLNPRQRRREAERQHRASGQAGVPRYTEPLELDRLERVVAAYIPSTLRRDVRRHLGRMRRPHEATR